MTTLDITQGAQGLKLTARFTWSNSLMYHKMITLDVTQRERRGSN
jgi:hypothetical protein